MSSSSSFDVSVLDCKFGFPTTYRVIVKRPQGERIVTRRYRDFERLREGLPALHERLPPLPPKAVPSMLKHTFRAERQHALDRFLASVMQLVPAIDNDALRAFLDVTEEEINLARIFCSPDDNVRIDGGGGAGQDAVPAAPGTQRQRWAQQSQVASGSSSSSTAPSPVSGSGFVNSSSGRTFFPPVSEPEVLLTLQVLPLQDLPAHLDGAEQRLQVITEMLRAFMAQKTVVTSGLVLHGLGYRFVVVKSWPAEGVMDNNTAVFVEGPTLPRLQRVQFRALKQRTQRETDTELISNFLRPHFVSMLADKTRCPLVTVGQILKVGDVNFHVSAVDPAQEGLGVVEESTQVFADYHDAAEFVRIHVVPFTDTLPSAYEFDLFTDYVKPFFEAHKNETFVLGQCFTQNGVQFKVVGAEPGGSCRVGSCTEIFTEGQLHPTAGELLTPDQTRLLAMLPPFLQMLALQSDAFGNGEVAGRIMAAQAANSQRRQSALSPEALDRIAQKESWTGTLLGQTNDSNRCVVCLANFHEGDGVRQLPCQHVFHAGCIDEWLERDARCPLCRVGLRPTLRRT